MHPILTDLNAQFFFKIFGLITLLGLCWIFSSLIHKIDVGPFGSDNEGKRKVIGRMVVNFSIFMCLCLVILAGIFNLVDEKLFIVYFTIGLSALGFKFFTTDIK